MSIAINSNSYSNIANTNTATVNQAKNSNAQSLVQTIKHNNSRFNFDSFETMVMDKTYRNEIIENPNIILHNYSVYFGNALTTEIALSFYEKGRDEILNAFSDDEELMNAHLKAFDQAFETELQHNVRRVAKSLAHAAFEAAMQASNEGFVANKLASHIEFNHELFAENSMAMMKEFGQTFLNNVRSGMDYTDARKMAVESMAKTTSVNNLSINDFMEVEKTWFGEHHVSRSELNNKFNNSKELSAELQALLK